MPARDVTRPRDAELGEGERVQVGHQADLLVTRLSDAVAAGLDPQQDRGVRRRGALEPGGHLLGVVRVDARVELTGGQQHRRVRRSIDDPVVRRAGVHRREQVGVLDGAELRDVEGPVRVQLDPQHVEHRYLGDDGPGDVRVLGEHGAHEQSAIGAATDDQLHRRHPCRDQVTGTGREVVEAVLLGEQTTAWCHSSPYSPPPRMFATASTAPCSTQSRLPGTNHGRARCRSRRMRSASSGPGRRSAYRSARLG